MVPLPVVVVVAVVAALALAVSGFIAIRLYPCWRQKVNTGFDASDDIEKAADAPLRRVQVRQGRIVSWHSTTTKSSSKGILRLPTPKIFSSRRSSTVSLPATIDLENEIAQFRKDYAQAKKLEMQNPGSGNVNGLVPVSRVVELPPAVIKPSKALSPIGESDDPMEQLNQSSWVTYNGHRDSDNPLASLMGPLSPGLEKALEVQDIETVPSSVGPQALDEAQSLEHMRSPDQDSEKMPESMQTDYRDEQPIGKPVTGLSHRPKLLKLDIGKVRSISSRFSPTSASPSDPKSPAALSIQSAIYKSPIQEIIPAAPQPRKPSKLDLRASFSNLNYIFPSPPSSSTVTSPTRASITTLSSAAATLGDDGSLAFDRLSTCSDQLCTDDIMAPVTSRSRASTRASSRSLGSRSRSSTHRVRRRPPPISTQVVPPLPGQLLRTPTEEKPLDTGAFLASPTASDTESLNSPQHKKDFRASVYSLASSTNSAFSPTFAVTPVFRVPLYTGKGTTGPKLKTISKKSRQENGVIHESADLERRGSDGDVVQIPKRLLREKRHPSILRTYSHNAADMEVPRWTSSDEQSMTCDAHDSVQRTGTTTPARLSQARPMSATPHLGNDEAQGKRSPRSFAHLKLRPILKNLRSVSHTSDSSSSAKEKAQTRRMDLSKRDISDSGSSHSPQISLSGSFDNKALPPVPASGSATPPGVQRVPISSLRIKLPDDVSAISEKATPSATTTVPPASSNDENMDSAPASATTPANLSPTTVRKQRRSGLDRISNAVSLGKPSEGSKPSMIVVGSRDVRAKDTIVLRTKLAHVAATGPVVTSREVSADHSSDHSSLDRAEEEEKVGKWIYSGSPVISAISHSNTPDVGLCKAAPVGRMRTNRAWDERSAVSPLSSEFPTGVHV